MGIRVLTCPQCYAAALQAGLSFRLRRTSFWLGFGSISFTHPKRSTYAVRAGTERSGS